MSKEELTFEQKVEICRAKAKRDVKDVFVEVSRLTSDFLIELEHILFAFCFYEIAGARAFENFHPFRIAEKNREEFRNSADTQEALFLLGLRSVFILSALYQSMKSIVPLPSCSIQEVLRDCEIRLQQAMTRAVISREVLEHKGIVPPSRVSCLVAALDELSLQNVPPTGQPRLVA